MKPNLLITTDCFLPRWDGIARFLKELIPYLKKEFNITVIAPKFEGRFKKIPGVKIIRLPLMPIRFGDIYFSWFKSKEIKKEMEKADLVFNQTIGPIGITAIRTAYKLRKPLISYVHSVEWELSARAIKFFKRPVWHAVRLLTRRMYNKCDLVLVPSKALEDLLTADKVAARKMVIPLGVDTNKFTPPKSKNTAKKKIRINPKNTVIGFSGRIGREKDLPTLINAFSKLQELNKNLKLLIIGSGIKLPKGKNIIYAGSTNKVIRYLQAMDIFAIPSLTETSSLATMEAMSCALPVVATPVGCIREYIKDGVNGLIFPRRNAEALFEDLQRLVVDPKLRKKLGDNARKTIVNSHQWTTTAQKITKLLKLSVIKP